MQVYLAVTPGEAREVQRIAQSGRTALAHVAYRVGPGSTLLRRGDLSPSTPRGGLLSISDREAPTITDPEVLCAAVLRECTRRDCAGALLDFEGPKRRDRVLFAEKLAKALSGSRRTLYLPEGYAPAAPGAVQVVCTALSGGNFSQRMREAARQCGRMALDLQRLRMDFRLPAPSGEGTPLSGEEFRQLVEREKPAVFFSQDLCARYFTYTREGQLHFVLFDDAETLERKLRFGAGLGASAAFFMWPEVRDIAGKLFR